MSSANQYDKGDRVVLRAYFTDGLGAPAAPTTIVLRIKNPAGTITVTAPSANPALGTYEYDLDLNAVGDWYYRYEGTGAVVAAGEKRISVRPTQF